MEVHSLLKDVPFCENHIDNGQPWLQEKCPLVMWYRWEMEVYISLDMHYTLINHQLMLSSLEIFISFFPYLMTLNYLR